MTEWMKRFSMLAVLGLLVAIAAPACGEQVGPKYPDPVEEDPIDPPDEQDG